MRFADGTVGEGPYVNGERNGHWVFAWRGERAHVVEEDPFVDGERHGDWVLRDADGDGEVWRFENGERVEPLAALKPTAPPRLAFRASGGPPGDF